MKKVVLVVAQNDYQPLEYSIPKDVLELAGVQVVTVSNQIGIAKSAGSFDSTEINLSLDAVNVKDFDGLFFIGGPGALDYLDNEISYNLLRTWQKTGKPYGAICISPRILANAGVLNGKKVTGWNRDEELEKILSDSGAIYVRESVVRDGNVVTADGPQVAQEFGNKILEVLE